MNRNNFAGFIFLIIWIAFVLFLGRGIKADLRGDGGYEPAKGIGHPLYQDY